MTSGLFITGTDTGIGKTVAAVALLHAFVASGRRAVGMKPVAAGFEGDASVNADVVALEAASITARSTVTPAWAAATCGAIAGANP